ncbi:phage integrase SAM-like domain-containing protein [Halapricum sp. CBA1109]|uniref:tyrosine-type recombinase/integrase n=1 Tax=Halapricum sp. CBA1109 TaxID=2668068 RepID=UPI001E2A9DA8|nr:phage integrase SAM-like domain-containing protein [Halapricum sp. CBA1109]
MSGPEPGGSTPETTIERAIQARLRSLDSGNYRANNELVLNEFAQYLREHRDVTELEEITVLDCRRYAQWLRKRVDEDDDLSAASVHANGPYFTIVRAFLGWCVDDERLDKNPARPNRVKNALPEYHGDHDRQFWSEGDRDELLTFADERVDNALDGSQDDRERAYRDRAVVAMLALTGARGAELFSDPRDDYRDGLAWDDVHIDDGYAVVFGKTREQQAIPLTERVTTALNGYKRVFAPASDDWPVFPTRHYPTLAKTARNGLAERGLSDDEIDEELEDTTSIEVLREHDITPPALSKNGAPFPNAAAM